MSPKIVLCTLFCAVASWASAQSVNLAFADDGDRQIWIASALPTHAPGDTEGVRTLKSDATIPFKDAKPSDMVFVWDRKRGNIAAKSVKDASAAIWEVKGTDFQSVAQVSVSVLHDGKPVAAATVDLDDGKHKTTELLDPSSKGVITFFGIKPGAVKVSVHYKVAGKEAPAVTQLVDVALTRTDTVPIAKIAVADAVDTVGSTAEPTTAPATATGGADNSSAPTKGSKADSDKSSTSEGFGSVLAKIVIYLLVLGAMGFALYYAMIAVKKNPDSVASKLEQLGVQIPKPGDDPITDPSQMPAPARPTPMPVQKIILDDAAPDPIQPVATAYVSSGVVDPKLFSESGEAMPVPEGELIVGRELGLGLSLVGESTVSRKHAQLLRNGNQVIVKDFGSTNGTFVNGVQLQGEKQLQSGDTVQFGSVRFRFEG